MKRMKLILQNISAVMQKIYDFITMELHLYQEERKNRNIICKNAQKQAIYYSFMERLADELSQVFAGKNYPCAEKIYSPFHLRIVSCRETNRGFIYTFSIAKNTTELVRDMFLADILDNMNRDVFAFWHRACEIYGAEYVTYTFPIIAAGVNIINVRDSGSGDILISVHSNMPPIP